MKCPRCGSSMLRIEVVFTGFVSCAFTGEQEFELIDTLDLDSNWDDTSPCECLGCDWKGVTGEALPRPFGRHKPPRLHARADSS